MAALFQSFASIAKGVLPSLKPAMSPASTQESYVIVGAGIFGTSTALHLAKTFPSASITLIDRTPFPCPLAASYDYQKVVRADYGNIFYMGLALKAQDQWRNEPLYSPYYHESGIVKIETGDNGKKMVENFKKLGVNSPARLVDVDTLKEEYPLFRNTNLSSAKDCYVNTTSGWAEATAALRATTQAAIDLGVTYVAGAVSKLLFDESSGSCCGVSLEDGKEFIATKVVLATGANTAKIIADSAPNRKDIQVEDRITGAAVVTGAVRLSDAQMKHYGSMPVFIHRVGNCSGETYPPTPENILKFCRDKSFTHNWTHSASNQILSTPPHDKADERQSECPASLRREIAEVMSNIFGADGTELPIESYRICWDAITPNQDFIISAHPRCEGLHFAVGGSFHGWKFLPTIGGYVVEMLKGTLQKELKERWAWDREQGGSSHQELMPQRDWKDLHDGKEEL